MSPALSGQTRGPLIRCLLSRYLIRVAEISPIILSQLRVIAPSGTPTIFTSLNYNMIIACNRVNVCNSWIIYVKSQSFRNDFDYNDPMYDKYVFAKCFDSNGNVVTLMQWVSHPHTTFLVPKLDYYYTNKCLLNVCMSIYAA